MLNDNELFVDATSYGLLSAEVTVSWSTIAGGTYVFYVTIMTSNETARFTTSNMSVTYSVLYNQDYQISVVANTCAGNSTLVNTFINISKPVLLITIINVIS